jgi:MFS family permease
VVLLIFDGRAGFPAADGGKRAAASRTSTAVKLWARDIPGPIRVLAAVSLVNSLGGSIMGPLVTLYVHDDLGRSVATAGAVLMLQSLAGIAGQVAGGLLHDRIRGRGPLIGALAAAGAACALLALTRTWVLYVSLMTAFGFTRAAALAPINALTSAFWPGGGRRAFNVLYVVRNVGFAAGAALGGLAAQRSFPLAFAAAAAVLGFAATLAAAALPACQGPPVGRPFAAAEPIPPAERHRRLGPILALGTGVVLASAVYAQWSTTVAVYMAGVGVPLATYGLLWTLNGLGVLALQPLGNLLVPRLPLRGQLTLSAAMYAGSCACLAVAHGMAGFVAGMLLVTAGEILDRPAWPAAAATLAPAGREGAYQGMVGAFQSGGRMLGPLAGGALYDAHPPATLWAAAGAAAVAAMGAYAAINDTPGRFRRRTRAAWPG